LDCFDYDDDRPTIIIIIPMDGWHSTLMMLYHHGKPITRQKLRDIPQ